MRVCVGAVVEIRPIATCGFVHGVKVETVRRFLLGVLNLNRPDNNSEVTVEAMTLVIGRFKKKKMLVRVALFYLPDSVYH